MIQLLAPLLLSLVRMSLVVAADSNVYHLTAKLAADTFIVGVDPSTYLTEVDAYLTLAAGSRLVSAVDPKKSSFTKGGKKIALTGLLPVGTPWEDSYNDNQLLSSPPYLTVLGITFSTADPESPSLTIASLARSPSTLVVWKQNETYGVGFFNLDAPTVEVLSTNQTTRTQPLMLGCYKDMRPRRGDMVHNREYAARAMQHVVMAKDMTVAKCASMAAKAGAPYFGLQFRTECWTSHNITMAKRYGRATPGSCQNSCGGGGTMCGGRWAFSLFKA